MEKLIFWIFFAVLIVWNTENYFMFLNIYIGNAIVNVWFKEMNKWKLINYVWNFETNRHDWFDFPLKFSDVSMFCILISTCNHFDQRFYMIKSTNFLRRKKKCPNLDRVMLIGCPGIGVVISVAHRHGNIETQLCRSLAIWRKRRGNWEWEISSSILYITAMARAKV